MVDRLIGKVNVFPGNRIEIEYKVKDLFYFYQVILPKVLEKIFKHTIYFLSCT